MSQRYEHITPSVIKWARDTAYLSERAAAKKIRRPEVDIIAWENGEKLPTFAQLRNASEVYKRPLSVFYLPEPPKDFQTLRDFRYIEGQSPDLYTPELAYMIRETQERQAVMSEVLGEMGDEPLGFIGRASLKMNIEELSVNIRKALGIEDNLQEFDSRASALRWWIDKAEGLGVYVFQAGNMKGKKVYPEEARGFAISDEYAPFIFMNAQDSKAARIFTLIHELTHLWLNESGISNMGFRNYEMRAFDQIEIYCNKTAAEVLVPSKLVLKMISGIDLHSNLEGNIRMLSDKFKISVFVVTRRLFDVGKINFNDYCELTDFFYEEWKKYKNERKGKTDETGGPSPHLMKVINNGRAYTRKVLSLYQSGEFSLNQAISLLNAKANHLDKIASYAQFPLRGRYDI